LIIFFKKKEFLPELLSIGWLEVGVGARHAFCLGVMLRIEYVHVCDVLARSAFPLCLCCLPVRTILLMLCHIFGGVSRWRVSHEKFWNFF
jgi:hypothetical protein